MQTITSGYRLTHPTPNSKNVPSVSNCSWTTSLPMTPGSYQDRCVGGVMWRSHCLSWSSFCRFPTSDEWNVSIVESMHDLENASSLVGICTSSPKRFWRGQRPMMREVWTYAADGSMTSGLERYHVPSFALKRSTASKSTSLCSWWRYSAN